MNRKEKQEKFGSEMRGAVVIYNDGEIVFHCIEWDDGSFGVGSVVRVHQIDGHHIVEQATREKFLADLPVNQGFLDGIDGDLKNWLEERMSDERASRLEHDQALLAQRDNRVIQ